jgi:hypothetical protein
LKLGLYFDLRDPPHGGAKPPVRVVTVDEAMAQLRAIDASATVEHVFFWERVAGMPDDIAARHVALIGDQLIPAVAEFDRAESHI